jgi:hypothetical protein
MVETRDFYCLQMSGLALWPTQLPIRLVLRSVSPDVKWLGHEACHSPPPAVKVKHMWKYASTPSHTYICLYGLACNEAKELSCILRYMTRMITGLHHGVNEVFALAGCYAV